MAAVDPAHGAADGAVADFAQDAAEVYGEAEKTARANLERYLERFRKADEEMRGKLGRGEITKREYREWRQREMLRGKRYRAVVRQMAEGYTEANRKAMEKVGDVLPGVYTENYNYGTYQVEKGAGVDTSFALQDASTVDVLLRKSGSYLPRPSVNRKLDTAWNMRKISGQITQGVMLGESIPKIARRVRNVTGSNMAAAMRTARTSVTAAENCGRVDSYRRGQSLGIDLEQEWLATLDGRTRASHRELDGERVEVGGTFSNGCRFPGDPEGPYSETMNCRCTLVAAVAGIDQSDAHRFSRLPEGMSYEEWKASKPAVNGAVPANRTIAEFMDMPGTKRKLDTAGVSKTEARRLLTRQLREYGIPSGSFRKMGAGDQQKALDAALVRELGALNNSNDPWGSKRSKHAARYYEEVRNRDMELEIAAVPKSSGLAKAKVRTAYEHVFIEEHDLATGHHRFDPDFDMAQSWQRLREGKTVYDHDVMLIEHEARESAYMKQGLTYREAHEKVCKEGYDYQKECDKWKESRDQ